MILLAVFLLSLSSLTYEVLLTRVFSISQWNHLSFMVISIALFGFATSGTFLSILESKGYSLKKQATSRNLLAVIITVYTITANGSFISLNQLPLEYLRLPLEPIQALYLLVAYLLLALPFFITGLMIAIAYAFFPDKTGLIYFSTMAGSAFGAVLPAPLLPLFGEENLIVIVNLLPLVAIPLIGFDSRDVPPQTEVPFNMNRKLSIFFILPIMALIALLFTDSGKTLIRVKPSPYKSLRQTLRFPNTRVTETVTSLRGRMDRVESPYIRFAQGLSLKFTEQLPQQWSLFKDGNAPLVYYNLEPNRAVRFPRYTLPFSGYVLKPHPERVLIILNGGGSAIPCAISSNAENIFIIEKNPYTAKVIRKQYDLPVINKTPRSYLAVTDAKFTIIHVEDWGPSIPGTAALNQDDLFTLEAFEAYLNHLIEDGVLTISRKLLLPPADSIRLWATAYESLRSLGMKSPERHIVILRNWDTFTLVVTKKPIAIPLINSLDNSSHNPSFNQGVINDFARRMNFDLVFVSGITQKQVNQFNVFDAPYHYLEISRLLKAYKTHTEKEFFQSYLLDVAPQSDNRPFPSRFLKWTRLKEQFQATGSRFYSLFLSGEIVVGVVFVEALAISFVLLLAPLFGMWKRRQRLATFSVVYFLGVGAGFMFIELYFIKIYTRLFGDPIISFTVVLSGILIFSAAGGFWSQRLSLRTLRISVLILIVLLVVILFTLNDLLWRILWLHRIAQYIFAFAILFPVGFLMGLPFPMGMKYLLKNPTQRAYAWAINGSTSVLTSIASAQIALSFGINRLIICAAVSYLVVLLVIRRS